MYKLMYLIVTEVSRLLSKSSFDVNMAVEVFPSKGFLQKRNKWKSLDASFGVHAEWVENFYLNFLSSVLARRAV